VAGICTLLVLVIFCGGGFAHAKENSRYQVIMLQPLSGGQSSSAFALNNQSEAVGYSNDSGDAVAVYWGLNRVPVEICSLGGYASFADGINGGSYVVGFYSTSSYSHAFLWDANSGARDLGALGDPGSSWASAINLKGQVAGYASSPSDPSQYWACLFEPGKLPVPIDQSGDCYAYGINDNGLVAGRYNGKPVVWNQGVRQELDSRAGTAGAVNNSNQVAGRFANAESQWRAFIWDKFKGLREITGLAAVNSYGNAINNKGQVVGRYETSTGQMRGFIWEEGKGAIDINTLVELPRDLPPGSYLMGCSAINDRGDILSAVDTGVNTRACLLRPGTSMAGIITELLN
jgi:probable HAF family extracellular repeat protein